MDSFSTILDVRTHNVSGSAWISLDKKKIDVPVQLKI